MYLRENLTFLRHYRHIIFQRLKIHSADETEVDVGSLISKRIQTNFGSLYYRAWNYFISRVQLFILKWGKYICVCNNTNQSQEKLPAFRRNFEGCNFNLSIWYMKWTFLHEDFFAPRAALSKKLPTSTKGKYAVCKHRRRRRYTIMSFCYDLLTHWMIRSRGGRRLDRYFFNEDQAEAGPECHKEAQRLRAANVASPNYTLRKLPPIWFGSGRVRGGGWARVWEPVAYATSSPKRSNTYTHKNSKYTMVHIAYFQIKPWCEGSN